MSTAERTTNMTLDDLCNEVGDHNKFIVEISGYVNHPCSPICFYRGEHSCPLPPRVVNDRYVTYRTDMNHWYITFFIKGNDQCICIYFVESITKICVDGKPTEYRILANIPKECRRFSDRQHYTVDVAVYAADDNP